MTNTSTDVIVVGGGVIGLWTAYHLAQEGVRTLLLEQFSYPHTRGSSHGQTRVIRASYSNRANADLMPEAFRRWDDLQNEVETKLYYKTGMLTIFDVTRYEKEFYSLLDNLCRTNVQHYVVPGASLERSFPGLSYQSVHKAIYDADTGVLMADRCTEALRNLILKKGVHLHEGEPVLSIKPVSDTKIVVKTSKTTYVSKAVVLTCGGYINKLLSTVNLKIPVQPMRVDLTYWRDKSSDKKYAFAKQFPCVIGYEMDELYYSVPSIEYSGLLKISQHRGTPCDPGTRDVVSPELKAAAKRDLDLLKESIRRRYPSVDASEPAIVEPCMFNETPDSKYILDFHPEYQNIIIGAGFSGHGFMSSPSVGHILKNMALGLQPPYSLEPFSLKRFDAQSKL